ncbi:vesicle-mediated transport-related protein [Ceraceosorus bombacis]|uniref:Vesicle-mediated transport-related protein n=1 Tax=Ceraceosorus bombacis TaxID=401625 RepID=A0A0P1B9R7_9BASI|nr:vesicle-mediated transport-related protein [Ceraceosorus bombacis]
MLRDLLADTNPTVVANAVAALTEISERSDNIQLKLNLTIASKLVSALPDCSEWGQTYILESLMFFVPQDYADAEILAERIAVRLQHANSAVVLTSVKLILYLMNYIASAEFRESLCKKIITLLSSGPEVQYVALRNILLVIQRRPIVLQHDVKVFFCKYNDPIYVKMAKLEIMYRLASERNVEQVLAELREYAAEVDVDFVRKAVRSIGRLAIKIESTADRCIKVLLSLIQTKVNYVVQEAIVVIKDIFRKYPDRYESIISVLCENLDSLDEPEARAAMVWIIGQYAERIENSDELLEDFLFTFLDEPVEVQLALLTATVKLFLKRPAAGGELVPKVLKWATEEVENPDLRDRGYMYWRLLSTDPAAARDVTFIRGSKARYLPDSPAIDEAAKKSASRHLYSRPTPRNASGLANVQAETGARAAPTPALPPRSTDGAAATDDGPATPGALARNGSSAPTASEGATAETNRSSSDEVRRGDSADGPSGANGEAEEDPYAMLGDLGPEFGGVGGGYAADAPAPRSGVDDLLA